VPTTQRPTTLFLCGDVMTGRGVDQILPHPGDPRLWESLIEDARGYVGLAEAANGPIPCPVDVSWPWGDALAALEAEAPDVRVVNLETSVTVSDDAADKTVLYRMAPANIGCLRVAEPDVCVLANNHVLDFGPAGLAETIDVVTAAGIRVVGAGADATEAARPAPIPVPRGRVVVVSCGTPSSGIPDHWAARTDRPGVNLVPELTCAAADAITGRLQQDRRPGDVAVVSVHWGSNWGYDVPSSHVDFAHRLIDGGVHIVHGHSSHHPRPIEVYRGRLILYGCGDFIDDYEGIGGYEAYRDDLRVMYFVAVDPDTGALAHLRMVPLQARQMRLRLAAPEDAEYLAAVLGRVSPRAGAPLAVAPDRSLWLRPS
jgi:poly-gamma-glutamate capsule biosynthesis protein CapA/YwtB (metallophosphatase superfamily)